MYFKNTDFNEWNYQDAFALYYEKSQFNYQRTVEAFKKDLSSLSKSTNVLPLVRKKAQDYLEQWKHHIKDLAAYKRKYDDQHTTCSTVTNKTPNTSDATVSAAPSEIANNITNSTMTIQTMNNSGKVVINNNNAPSSASAGNKRKVLGFRSSERRTTDNNSEEVDQESNAAPSDHPIIESDETAIGNQPAVHNLSAVDNESPADNEPSVYINCQDDIWACWRSYLEDESLHTYSLERLGIIQCGYQLQCRDHYLPELYDLLVYDSTARTNPVSNHAEIFDPIFDQAANKSLMARLLDMISYDDKQNTQVFMVATVINILLQSIFSNNCVCEHEGNYCHYVIWPLLDTIVKTVAHLNFHCGEYRLEAVEKELARRRIGGNHHYKADGCISVAIDGIRVELALLEVSGPFKLDDESRIVKDHVKAGYGLVAMLNGIARLYNFASFDVFSSLRIFFVHAKKNKLRFWSFEMPSPGLYVLNLVNSVAIPEDCASCDLPVESICVELWNLRSMVQQTLTAIDALKSSHITNQRAYTRASRNSPDLQPILLTDSLRIHPKVKLDVDYIPGCEELALNSNPF
ncbi:hypothetical protein [Parasitella parasitica]|uniref:Uncharacterized protein n=1 Tax=Parasitella parasitica TaxID=35722 RepID=A0A0B7NTK9_9FUNG|nr:hypothetical protein [Parasitella parasitica]